MNTIKIDTSQETSTDYQLVIEGKKLIGKVERLDNELNELLKDIRHLYINFGNDIPGENIEAIRKDHLEYIMESYRREIRRKRKILYDFIENFDARILDLKIAIKKEKGKIWIRSQ